MVGGTDGLPLLVAPDKAVSLLTRLPFEQAAANPTKYTRYDESWIQELIYAHPQLLPVSEFDRAFAPALLLAREVDTPAGPIDVLLTSPTGHLTIVETKLWRNPEARRTVIGQIIDYVKELTHWDLQQLTAAVRAAETTVPESLYQFVAGHDLDVSERDFVDSLNSNLERGRVLLLIVGDGIREGMQAIGEYLQRFAHLQFMLGLVDLSIYERTDGSRFVVPRVVSRTREVPKGVIRIEAASGVKVSDVTVEELTTAGRKAGRFTLGEADFLAQVDRESGPGARAVIADIHEVMQRTGLRADYRQSSFTARLSNPLGGTLFSLFNVDTDGNVVFGYLRTQLERYALPLSIQEMYASDITTTFGIPMNKWGYPDAMPFSKYRERTDAFERAVREVISAINDAAVAAEARAPIARADT